MPTTKLTLAFDKAKAIVAYGNTKLFRDKRPRQIDVTTTADKELGKFRVVSLEAEGLVEQHIERLVGNEKISAFDLLQASADFYATAGHCFENGDTEKGKLAARCSRIANYIFLHRFPGGLEVSSKDIEGRVLNLEM